MKKLFSLMLAAFIGLTAFAAEEKSLCPAGTLADGKVTHELECCTIVQEQGESTTVLKSVSPWQAPAKSVMTITPKEGVSIEQFIVNTKNTTLGTYIGKSELTNASKTATKNGEVTFTVTNGTEPVVMKFVSTTIKFCELTITYTQEGSSVTPEPEDTTIVTPEPEDPVIPEPEDTTVVTPEPETGITYNVTVPAGTKACYIAGEMNTWSFTEMTKVDDTHYTLKLADATESMKYKYCSGPSWAYVEKTANGDEVADRTYSANDVVETWASVYDPSNVPTPGEAKDITIKAKVPATWTNTITAWVWPTGGNGKEVTPAKEGEWYVYTENCSELNIIFKNGAGWNGDKNQTVDITISESACVEITAGTGKANYTKVDCEENPGEEPGDDPVVEPETGVTYNVTVPAGTKACYIAGEMNAWKQQEMTKVDETHYTITIAEATTAMKYKYCSGPSWDYVEMQADGVTDVQDRTYAANDVVEAWKAVYEPAGENPGEEPGDDPVVEPDGDVWTVLGVDALGLNWTIEATDNDMVKQEDGSYKLVKENLELGAGNYDYKVAKNHSWDVSIPAGQPNQTLTIETSGIYNVTFVLDAACTTLTATAELVQAGEVIPVVGMHGNFLGTWADTEKFTMAEDKLTASLVLTIPVGEYEFGMQIAGVWTANGTAFTRENTSAAIVGTSPNNTLSADVEGEYTFTWTYETSTLTIAYPVAGDDPVDPETAVDNVAVGEMAVKVIRNGQMYIIRNGVIYNAMGQIAE